jgi:hypothetical protein
MSSDLAFFRNAFIRAAGSALPVEDGIDEPVEAGAMFDECMALPADQFMSRLLDLIRNAHEAPSWRVQSAVALVTALAEARHLVGQE